MVNVDVLYVPECPNVELARQRLTEAAARASVQLVVRERVVADADGAAELGMRGSPTILVEGRDVAGASGLEPSVSCRLYPAASGIEGAPSVDELVAALTG